MKANLSIVIPTLNNIRGLKYLLNYFGDKSYKLIIIDNKKKNLGFAGGVNKGAKKIKTKWMLILNDDIEFYKQFQRSKIKDQNDNSKIKNSKNPIEQLIQFTEKNKLDAVSPVLINPNGEVENLGYKVLSFGRIFLVKELTGSPPFAEASEGKRVNELDGLTAACLLINTKIFKKLGGFDESFFAYLEDVDFFLRFKKAGYKMGVADHIKVLHNHMTTTKTMGNFKARQDMINWWQLYFKHKEKFQFDAKFILERFKNISGYLKATFSTLFSFQKNLRV